MRITRQQIMKVQAKVQAMLSYAEDKADSEDEAVGDKYAAIMDGLQLALDGLDEALLAYE